jgi:hypothetical protein
LAVRSDTLKPKREVVEILILAICRIKELEDLVPLDINRLDED